VVLGNPHMVKINKVNAYYVMKVPSVPHMDWLTATSVKVDDTVTVLDLSIVSIVRQVRIPRKDHGNVQPVHKVGIRSTTKVLPFASPVKLGKEVKVVLVVQTY
tara:strand:+ start:267 stop:575 length:309 start_codon:yes stop_codon:yes gene_type:complete